MKSVEMKTSDLEGAALDWAVATSLNGESIFFDVFGSRMLGRSITKEVKDGNINPSTNWAQGGPLIDDHDISMSSSVDGSIKFATIYKPRDCVRIAYQTAPTRLMAACRAIVAAKSGDTVNVPAELVTK